MFEIETMGERIKRLRIEKNLTQEELGKLVGLQRAAINKYEKGEVENMKRSIVSKMSNIFNVAPSYLMALDNDNIGMISVNKLVKIPILGEIACGVPLLAEQNIEGYRYEISDILPTGELFFLKAKGDSMFPTIPDKSFVLIRRQESVEDGEIAAVLVNNDTEATLKRVKYQGDIILLMPDNNEYLPYVVNKDNDAKIIGKAIKLSVDL